MYTGPVYEITVYVNPDVVGDYEHWLDTHARRAKEEPGVVDCRVFKVDSNDNGWEGHVCQYLFEDDECLDAYLERQAADPALDAEGEFGDQIEETSRVLRDDTLHSNPADEQQSCLNCGAKLRGQYCGHCGQRARNRLISLWELVTDAFGDLFEIDSRLWQTLIPILIRPGLLTHDYLQGRRARYMPPFRMYLVLSLIFFVVAFFDPREDLGLLFEPEETTEVTPEPADESEAAEAAEEVAQEVLDELAEEGVIVNGSGTEFNVTFDKDGESEGECEITEEDIEDLPDWLARRLTKERLAHICERAQLDDGRVLLDNMLDNIPAALIILLPVMAFVLKALYPLSRRYYVEHLLFFVHFHAFFFLILTLQIVFARLANLINLPEAISVLTIIAAALYIPVYLFMSMRRVYGQGRLITFLKYVVLTVSYIAGFAMTMLGALAIAAFSI